MPSHDPSTPDAQRPRVSTPVENARFFAANESIQALDLEDDEMLENLDHDVDVDDTMDQGGLDVNVYDQIVQAASEAATIASLRAVRSWAQNSSHSVPVPLDHPNSDGNESETGVLKPFEPPRGKKRVPRANRDKLVDEAMRKFLERKGVLARKNYFPDEPEERLVKAFGDHGVLGPDPNAPRVSLRQTFNGKWNKEVVEMLTAAFISAVKQGIYNPIQPVWPQMKEDRIRKRCQSKLYRMQYICRTRRERSSLESDKVDRMRQRRQETYYRRRKIHDLNFDRDPEAWKGVGLLLDALGTLGTSDDETDDDSEHPNPDARFKTLQRVDMGFLNPGIATIWASVESYPSTLRPSRGNRSFMRIPRAKSISKNRTPLPGLPINFYNTEWLQKAPPHFQKQVRAEVPLPVLVPYEKDDS